MSIDSKHAYRFGYLKSDKWKNVRLETLVRESGKCQICSQESISNDAHHMWYPENIWETTSDHLVILCRPCHDFLHTMLPECKTKDEERGRHMWFHFANSVRIWRQDHAHCFKAGESPKNLRDELARVKMELAELKTSGSKITERNQIDAIIEMVKRWGHSYLKSASSGVLEVEHEDYKI